MLGNFQQSHLRIELNASETKIKDSLLKVSNLRQWLWPQMLEPSLPDQLDTGLNFTSQVGFVAIHHQIESVNDHCLRMLLSGGIDGYHEWSWGDGWVQSRLEGISLLPLNLGQTWSLTKLRQFVTSESNS
ncbi:hypothetical protein C7H19_03610 [Aphanothece hegewaldii CCALA 016]|uniref:Uncharacterized protein n=1 Tax=Aphanothece hegewaldii CCALA 016 TaxID=2107694 RepID=A0A2T1M1U6_9CHRO|nr:hypothetical protein [Aphanothece hegewaldii]PSF38605.1 hypothetical protein C7H19_03610 [Aphanothece hegewaldii CCALA 016]